MYPKTTAIECRNWKIGDHSFQFIQEDACHHRPDYCENCTAILIAEKLSEARIKTAEKLDATTPARYLATDANHQNFNATLQSRLERWEPTQDHPWLGLAGPTGRCKTRCAFLLLRRLVMAGIECDNLCRGATVPGFAAVTSNDFAAAVVDQYGPPGNRDIHDDNRNDARRLLDSLKYSRFILFDDLGKARNTPAVSAALFAMLDERHAENRVTIWTSNGTPESIVAGMSDDMAGPLAGRIRECSTIINLK
jgi:hypothetical protein